MWHEARRRERATQKLFSDHKKRAERRREENRADPSGLLHVNGVKSKINIDINTHKQATNSMVVWQGDQKTTIDRFDVRTTLSSLPLEDRRPDRQEERGDNERRRKPSVLDLAENEFMRKILNFERYCLVMQNDINKVPEKTRLNLVERKNDVLSDAKMRKLKSNWFGTSGETSIPGDYTVSDNRHLSSRSQGVSIRYDYGVATTNVTDESSNLADSSIIPNPDDCEAELDLDCVDKIQSDANDINVAINRYGLNCDEFNMLVESASCSTKEIIHKLKLIKDEAKREDDINRRGEVAKQQDYYGPSLPPEMQTRKNDTKSGRPTAENIRQTRETALRDTDLTLAARDNDTSLDDVKLQKNVDQIFTSQRAKSTERAINSPEEPNCLGKSSHRKSIQTSSSSSIEIKSTGTHKTSPESALKLRSDHIKINLKTTDRLESSSDPIEDNPKRERRAATPLAYKRYCRSSRSISRERVSHSQRRPRSSSSSSFTSSHDTSSSSTNSSPYEPYRSRTRRRGRSSRSPSYRGSRRRRRKYRRRGRR